MKAIHQAAQKGDIDGLKLQLERGISIDTQASDKSTPLHYAIYAEKEATVRFLLEHGAAVNLKNQRGLSPLHIAANTGNEILTVLLLEASSNPNSKDGSVCLFSGINSTSFFRNLTHRMFFLIL